MHKKVQNYVQRRNYDNKISAAHLMSVASFHCDFNSDYFVK